MPNTYAGHPVLFEIFAHRVELRQGNLNSDSQIVQANLDLVRFNAFSNDFADDQSRNSEETDLDTNVSNIASLSLQTASYEWLRQSAGATFCLGDARIGPVVVMIADGAETILSTAARGHLMLISEFLSSYTKYYHRQELLLQYLVAEISEFSAKTDVSDPVFLSRPTNWWRMRVKPYQTTDDWKFLMRIRHCASLMEKKRLESACDKEQESDSKTLFEVVAENFGSWHHWEMGKVKDSKLFCDIYNPFVASGTPLESARTSIAIARGELQIVHADGEDVSVAIYDTRLMLDTNFLPIAPGNETKVYQDIKFHVEGDRLVCSIHPFLTKFIYRAMSGWDAILSTIVASTHRLASKETKLLPKISSGVVSFRQGNVLIRDQTPVLSIEIFGLRFAPLLKTRLSTPDGVDPASSFISEMENIEQSLYLAVDRLKSRLLDDSVTVMDMGVSGLHVSVADTLIRHTRERKVLVKSNTISVQVPKSFLV